MQSELEGALYVTLEGRAEVHLQGARKNAQIVEEKDTFDVAVDGLFCSAIEGTPEGAPKDALNYLCKDSQEATMKFESKKKYSKCIRFSAIIDHVRPLQRYKPFAEEPWVEGRGVKSAVQYGQGKQSNARLKQLCF